ncbi:MAG: hypothetical protein Q7T76_11685 [Ferruginibacter sp.]|nr:hypothetical protein [Ferruginibacter sp.]
MKTLLCIFWSLMLCDSSFSQNIGIGTTTPLAQFHTTGSVLFGGLTNNNTYSKVLVQDNTGLLHWREASSIVTPYAWLLTGNATTNPALNFLGTTDDTRFVIKTNSMERINILGNGNIGINIANPAMKLDIYSETDNTHLRVSGKSPAIVFADGTNTPTSFNSGDIGIATFSSAFVPTSKVGDMVIRNYGTGPRLSGVSRPCLCIRAQLYYRQ